MYVFERVLLCMFIAMATNLKSATRLVYRILINDIHKHSSQHEEAED